MIVTSGNNHSNCEAASSFASRLSHPGIPCADLAACPTSNSLASAVSDDAEGQSPGGTDASVKQTEQSNSTLLADSGCFAT